MAKSATKQGSAASSRTESTSSAPHRKLAESAERLSDSTGRIEDSADRTTQLAADRTILAAERTYAAWTRTSLVALTTGVGAKALLVGIIPNWILLANSTVLILFSICCLGAGVWRQIYAYSPPPRPSARQLPAWLLISVNAFLAFVAFAALIGIWTVIR
jgi:inner membrane protein YidH